MGAHPDYTATFPDGAHYYSAQYNGDTTRNDIRWWDNTDGTYMDPDNGVFQAWHQYEVQIWLTAEGGYAFANSTTATLNGQTALAMSGSQLRVAYTVEQICTVSGSVSGNKLTYTVAGAPAGAVLIASRYDGGRMTWVQMVSSPGAAGTLTVGGSGSVYKLFLVDGSSLLPLCPA